MFCKVILLYVVELYQTQPPKSSRSARFCKEIPAEKPVKNKSPAQPPKKWRAGLLWLRWQESNLRWRSQSPLPYRLATAQKKNETNLCSPSRWGAYRDSNPGSPDPQSGALTGCAIGTIYAPEGTRTPGPLLRRQLLYPPELRAHEIHPGGHVASCILSQPTGECQGSCTQLFVKLPPAEEAKRRAALPLFQKLPRRVQGGARADAGGERIC